MAGRERETVALSALPPCLQSALTLSLSDSVSERGGEEKGDWIPPCLENLTELHHHGNPWLSDG